MNLSYALVLRPAVRETKAVAPGSGPMEQIKLTALENPIRQPPSPGVPPLSQKWFHRTPIHTILDERLGIFESYYETHYF